jgi:hypothetical protein
MKSLEPKASLLNKSSCLAPALGVAKVILVTDMILVPLLRYISQTHMFNKPTSVHTAL